MTKTIILFVKLLATLHSSKSKPERHLKTIDIGYYDTEVSHLGLLLMRPNIESHFTNIITNSIVTFWYNN
jgi:hypothetical protein